MNIETAYARLYDALWKDRSGNLISISEQENVSFTAMQGHRYFESKDHSGKPFRMMLVGRAANGWEEYRGNGENTPEVFVDASLKNLTNDPIVLDHGKDRFEWIITKDNTATNTSGNYRLTGSPFWAYTKAIWDALYGEEQPWDKRWFETIVWSNLYKISPIAGWNPDAKLIDHQEAACIQILQAEIEYFEPTHILFATGTDWFKPFAGIFSNQKFRQPNRSSGKNKNSIYVEGTAEYITQNEITCKAVIACRPEMRNKDEYTQQVADFLLGNEQIP